MYEYKYYRHINFLKIPNEIVSKLPLDHTEYTVKSEYRGEKGREVYFWSDDHNLELNEWGQKNICPEMYFAFQVIRGGDLGTLPIHKDTGSKTKLIYLLDTGGDDVITNFYNDEKEIVQSVKLMPHEWYILKVDSFHDVIGIEPGRNRIAVMAMIF